MQTITGMHMPTTLKFVESEDAYSVYLDKVTGEEVYLAHGTSRRLVTFDDLDITARWNEYLSANSHYYNPTSLRDGFMETLRESIIDPDALDDVGWCPDCNVPMHEDYLSWMNDDANVCEPCSRDYRFCADCDDRFRYTTLTLASSYVCEPCRDENWSFCEGCDGWHPDDEMGHDSDDNEDCSANCESPAMDFTIRNDGDPALANDTRVTVTLPAGEISEEGLYEIANYLRSYSRSWGDETVVEDAEKREKLWSLSLILEELGNKWQTKEGNYTKRLSRFAYKKRGIKLPPDLISQVGCIASDHSAAVDFQIETTRDLNQSAADFGHEESCYWQSYFHSRCTLKSNGGFGLRTFNEDHTWGNGVRGRAWVFPLRKEGEYVRLNPTFDTVTPDAFVVFNGYGDLQGYTGARIMAHMAGMTYRKIDLTISPMYINSEAGYLVAPEEIAEHYTDGALALSLSYHSDLYTTEQEVLSDAVA